MQHDGKFPDFPKADEHAALYCLPRPARIRRTLRLGPQIRLLTLEMDKGAAFSYFPGQFVQLSVFGFGEAPVSICSSPENSDQFELCIRDAGNLTHASHHLEAGDWAGVRGPFGRGFPLGQLTGKDILAVAGGIGVAPLRSLIHSLIANTAYSGRISLFYGAKKPSGLLFADELEKQRDENRIDLSMIVDEPDDQWAGAAGVVTDPLRAFPVDNPGRTAAVIAGPPVMYRFALMELLEKDIPEDQIYFTLERRFECGIGKCGHCQLDDLYVCRDGPVFPYSYLKSRSEFSEIMQNGK